MAPSVDEPHCAATWFDMSRTDSDQGAMGSAGDHRSVALGRCEAVPASSDAFSEAGLQRCAAFATDRMSEATTLAPIEEPSSGSGVSAMESPKSVGAIGEVNRGGTPEDGGLMVVTSETESLIGTSEASGEDP